MLRYVSVFVAALVLSVVVTPVIRWIAIRLKVVDVPGERRIHSRPIPRLGGIAVYASLVSALCGVWAFEQYVLGSSPGYAGELPALFVGATAVMLLGAVDDCRPLTPRVKFTVQVLAAMVVVVTGNQIHSILGFDVGPLAIPITVLWVVGVTNALNLIDGLDGLAAGTGVIVSLTLAALLLTSGRIDEALILVALGGSLLGFLRYNFHPASIFLGDSGSLLLG
ncbi:MAG: UDP-GlcNAc:undecaprenyl-phosphate/decaprenyl-phosphate GlcNAc-phosphate transferase, partial [Candidatus Binatota bacterium]|nr:UDP-GlcNAc:undecaprenyl-phosphate/decaprenyl-phosphate GlcNAc-phosphate transferase [Candidatus Binatota bacterium]